MHPDINEEFLGVDVGDKRVGIARGSTVARLAQPLKTITADAAVAEIAAIANQYQISGIVVGLPRSLDGSETSQTKNAREWVRAAQEIIKHPFFWQDEALTSVAADLQARSAAGSDADAASVILQDFLDTPPTERVRC